MENLLLAIIVHPRIVSNFLAPTDLGKSINIFKDYEFFDYASREPWDDLDNTADHFFWGENKTIFRGESFKTYSRFFATSRRNFPLHNVGKRSLDVCHNLEQLYDAYFRDISVERVPDKWFTFTRNWDRFDKREKFDIPRICFETDDCLYVLLKVSLIRFDARIQSRADGFQFTDSAEEDLKKIHDNSPTPINAFITQYGTHYIQHYATGVTLYQVFVYNKTLPYIDIILRNANVEQLRYWENKYFSPKYAIHIGEIKSADGNITTEEWAARVCEEYYTRTQNFPNLLNLHRSPTALREFQHLTQNKTIIELGLYSITDAIKNRTKREWFHEILDNNYLLLNENA